jgi:hypothetical protein
VSSISFEIGAFISSYIFIAIFGIIHFKTQQETRDGCGLGKVQKTGNNNNPVSFSNASAPPTLIIKA